MNEKSPQTEKERPIEYPDIAEDILKMAEEDQRVRNEVWGDPLDEGRFKLRDIDARNTARMKEIIAQIGWPTKSRVGTEGSEKAWLLVQHADDDPAFQRTCLDLMKECPKNEVSPINVAYLEDRVLIKETGKQKYGTQFWTDEAGKYGPRPVEDEERVEERRAELGMETFEENKARMFLRVAEQQEKLRKNR